MNCPKCGNELPGNVKFCDKCGAPTGFETQGWEAVENTANGLPPAMNPVSSQIQHIYYPEETEYLDQSSYNQLFVEPDEQLLGTLGNGWITNMIFHKLKKCNALLTNKRLYLQGTFFSGNGKSLMSQRYEKVIDLEDITGSGFLYSAGVGILINLLIVVIFSIIGFTVGLIGDNFDLDAIAIVCGIIGFVVGVIIDVVRYLMGRKTFFLIEYAGGGIRFNASIIGIADVRDFQKQIRRAKDKAKGKI